MDLIIREGPGQREYDEEYDIQFARLRDYIAECWEANPGSVVEIDTVKNDAGQDLFNRFYVCFDALRRTWKQTCRPLLGVDGCFLNKLAGRYLELLVALGRDADNSIYPIAWSVVQVENIDNWVWFVKRLKIDLGLNDGDGYILVSDRQKRLIKAVELELPKMEHIMFCTPYVAKFLATEHKMAFECKVNSSTNGMYEVMLDGDTHRMCLKNMLCTCQKFKICGIPCEHAYGVILKKTFTAEHYVCQWFRTSMWKLNYTEGLVPQRGFRFWLTTAADIIHEPPEPPQPGRKKITKVDKKRKKGVHESPTKKQPKLKKRIMHCGICGSDEHNCS